MVVECVGTEPGDNRMTVGGTGSAVSGNKLKGQYFNCDIAGHINRVKYDPTTMRVLGRCADGSLGFVKASGLDYVWRIRHISWCRDGMRMNSNA